MKAAVFRRLGVVLALVGVVACLDDQAIAPPPPPPPASGLIISNPVPNAALSATARVELAQLVAGTSDVVYVSLTPGTAPTGTHAIVHRLGDPESVTTFVFDGGFDPVPLPAQMGDTIAVQVSDVDERVVFEDRAAVTTARPPVVVRTEPPPRKRDVPLNAAVVIVFSEPIDSTTLTDSTVELWHGAARITGRVSWRDSAHVIAAFAPDSLLGANTDYTLLVTQGIRDRDGQELAAAISVDFTTGATAASPEALAIVRAGDLYVVNTDGTGFTRLTTAGQSYGAWWSPDGTKIVFDLVGGSGISEVNADGTELTSLTAHSGQDSATDSFDGWSPDGSKIALTRGNSRAGGLYVMNADGSGPVLVDSTGSHAVWSPDGSKIAFSRSAGLYVMKSDGSGAVLVDSMGGGAVWSPEGSRIAFVAGRDVFVSNHDGSGAAQLTHADQATTLYLRPAWSPDGARIAFAASYGSWYYDTFAADSEFITWDSNWDIFVMNADGSGLTHLLGHGGSASGPGVGGLLGGPVWSPDGTSLAITIDENRFARASGGIALISAVGSGASFFAGTDGATGTPAWKPR